MRRPARKRSLGKRIATTGVYFLVPAVIILGIWYPVLSHYHVSKVAIDDQTIESARRLPEDAVLEELAGFFPLTITPIWDSDDQLIDAAEGILEGRLEIPWYAPTTIGVPFDPNDLEQAEHRLVLASFTVPKVLMEAYTLSGREEFLTAARDIIVAWARYERKQRLPKGLLWNDHAIFARVQVLTEFWRLYRNHPSYDPKVAKDVLLWVARSGQMLAKPAHFTARTNHGVMQNLGLWHICLAFPTIPNAEEYEQLAMDRQRQQMVFFLNEEGVFLEHSAFYQYFDLSLISNAFRYLTLLDISIPEEWIVKYDRAKAVYGELRRPDGSLPLYGDTPFVADPMGPWITDADSTGESTELYHSTNWAPKSPYSLFPIAGYCVWWDGLSGWPVTDNLKQTVTAWSYFPGHAHKHADELSVQLWANGQVWWTNVGYWRYTQSGREDAESWAGSNAPHLTAEPADSERKSKLLGHGWSEALAVVDLERTGPGDYVARRQLVHVKPNLWVVVDHISGVESGRSETVWNTAHDVELRKDNAPGRFKLRGPAGAGGGTRSVLVIGYGGMSIVERSGSLSPFGGWEIVDYQLEAASAIVVEQPAGDSWVAAIWWLHDEGGPNPHTDQLPTMTQWGGADSWTLALPAESRRMNLRRDGETIIVDTDGGGVVAEVRTESPPDVSAEVAAIRSGFQKVHKMYPRFRALITSRQKVTLFLLVLFLAQELFFFVYCRFATRFYAGLRVVSLLCWLGAGTWLLVFYYGKNLG